MSDEELVVTISTREIYDEIVGVREDVRDLVRQDKETAERIADHEARLRGVERWKYGIPVTTVSAIVALVLSFKGNP